MGKQKIIDSLAEIPSMDEDSLAYLLSGGHYNMEQRIEKGIWPHPPIPIQECIDVIRKRLDRERFFPRPYEPPVPGKMVGDVCVLEKISDKKYILHSHSASAYNPYILNEKTKKKFKDADKAIREYLYWEFHLPGDLDGWKVV